MVLLAFGLAALAGIWLTGQLVDRHLRVAVLSSLTTFAAVAIFVGIFSGSAWAIYAGVFIWGLSFSGGAATLWLKALTDAAGESADVALSMNVVVWSSAIAGGDLLGGVLLDQWGTSAFPSVLLALLLSLAIAFRARAQGFSARPPAHQSADCESLIVATFSLLVIAK